MLQLFVRQCVEAALLVAGGTANHPAARDIVVIPHRTDQVGIEGQQIAFFDDPVRGFLEPRVGAWTAAEQPRFRVFAAAANAALEQHGERIALAHARFETLTHRRYTGLAGLQRTAQGFHLVD